MKRERNRKFPPTKTNQIAGFTEFHPHMHSRKKADKTSQIHRCVILLAIKSDRLKA